MFKLAPPAVAGGAWTETALYAFKGGSDGANPAAEVIDLAGNLYGTTFDGGITGCRSKGCGTVFRLSAPASAGGAWTETVLYAFPGRSHGANPQAALLYAAGHLYGTTARGGLDCLPNATCGVVFRLTPPAAAGDSWIENVLHRFRGGSDGELPLAALIDVQGTLYGTTSEGGGACGGSGCGTVFSITKRGAETVLYPFPGGTAGQLPVAGLTEVGGALYGTTREGGDSGCRGGCGTVFEVAP